MKNSIVLSTEMVTFHRLYNAGQKKLNRRELPSTITTFRDSGESFVWHFGNLQFEIS
jgi:hypothetical protein